MALLTDSHCHLDRIGLENYGNFSDFIEKTTAAGVARFLCVSIDLETYPDMLKLVEPYDEIAVSVGVHPNNKNAREPSVEELVELSKHKKNIAIGETGLDYFRVKRADAKWQQQRFRTHIRAACKANKPLIIHSRDAREDTIGILGEEGADQVGGVLHCFTENLDMALKGLDLGFYISFSGIITFNNADNLREVAKALPLDRLLIETDSPWLAPAPMRGRPNEPKHVVHVAKALAELRDITFEEIAQLTSENYQRLFFKQ